jgi:chromosome segregation ATPase
MSTQINGCVLLVAGGMENYMARKKTAEQEAATDDAQVAEQEIQQEKRTEDAAEPNMITFKKVMGGYKPSEVNEYIEALNANLESAQQVFDAQSAELKSNLAFVSRERDKFKEEHAAMLEKLKKCERKVSEYETAINEREALKTQNAQLQEQVRSLFSKLELCKNLVTENRTFKSKIAEIDIERKYMDEQKALLNAEIAKLREANTSQAYDFAEQKKDMEAQFLNNNLRLAELLQVHTYHIEKTDELLNEAIKQFSQAKKSLDGLNSN